MIHYHFSGQQKKHFNNFNGFQTSPTMRAFVSILLIYIELQSCAEALSTSGTKTFPFTQISSPSTFVDAKRRASNTSTRRRILSDILTSPLVAVGASTATGIICPLAAFAEDDIASEPVQVLATGEVKKVR